MFLHSCEQQLKKRSWVFTHCGRQFCKFNDVYSSFRAFGLCDIGLWLAQPICDLLLCQARFSPRVGQYLNKKLVLGCMCRLRHELQNPEILGAHGLILIWNYPIMG